MKTEQYERILEKLERTAELLQHPERATKAGRILAYSNVNELQNDINELRDVFERNRLFLVDVADSLDGLNFGTLDELPELPDLDELPEIDELTDIGELEI